MTRFRKKNDSNDKKNLIIGFGAGIAVSSAIFIGYKLWISSYRSEFHRISRLKYSSNEKINAMLHACATIINMNTYCFLSTIKSDQNSPCCRMIANQWPVPVTMPYIYIGSNKLTRKYEQIAKNNNVVLTFGDTDMSGPGYVCLYGQCIEMKDKEKAKSMFPALWRLFLDGPEDPRFVMYTLYIEKIEFVSIRFGFDSTRNDWKPFVLKRVKDTLFSENAKWEIVNSPDTKLLKS